TAGVHAADPRIVNESRKIPQLTFAELSELSAAGAEIFHDEAVVPVRRTGVPLHIRSTKNPDDPGTIVLPDSGGNLSASSGRITGIAGKKGYVVITLERLRMNKQVGFIRTLMETLERRGINVDHVPSGKNTLSVVIHQSEFRNDLKSLMNEVGNACQPERMYASPGVALIAVVGRGMAHSGIAGTLFAALGRAKINVRLIDQGASELSIVIGVRDSDYEASVRTIYQAFFGKGKGE
ncbi:MAG: aspartate kinase, partial [Parcubacteria group bacterium]|nr:aspartate kinase [Parcubacteria group bacterium]